MNTSASASLSKSDSEVPLVPPFYLLQLDVRTQIHQHLSIPLGLEILSKGIPTARNVGLPNGQMTSEERWRQLIEVGNILVQFRGATVTNIFFTIQSVFDEVIDDDTWKNRWKTFTLQGMWAKLRTAGISEADRPENEASLHALLLGVRNIGIDDYGEIEVIREL